MRSPQVIRRPPSLPLDDANITKSINTFEEDLGRRRGITGIPLPYVTRFLPDVPPAHLDQPFGDTDSSYVSMDDEMIGLGQIYSNEVNCDETDGPFSKVFLIDSATVLPSWRRHSARQAFGPMPANTVRRRKDGRLGALLSSSTLVTTGS